MTPLVEEGKIRFVLSWPYGPKDLDIHSFFKVSRFSKCEVFFGKRDCVGTSLDTDNFSGGNNGVETITINQLGKYVYTFAVHKYTDVSNGVATGDSPVNGAQTNSTDDTSLTNRTSADNIPDVPLSASLAKISVYDYGFKESIYQISVPTTDPNNLNASNWWLALCLDGNAGINSLTAVNELYTDKPDYTICENLFANAKS